MKLIFKLIAAVLAIVALYFIYAITTELIAKNLINSAAVAQNAPKITPQSIQRGEYLATVGNCAACHTERGGQPFAGGKAIHTPFGAVYASNITPHPSAGIGRYSPEAFYRAMTEGIAASGQLLTPAFPYPNFKHISRADSDDLYAYFQFGVQAVEQPNKAHEMDWPLNTQLALAAWRVLFFKADTTNSIANYAINSAANGQNAPKTTAQEQLERGRYLVQGLGHCSACHSARNALGAARGELLSGSLMPLQDWYAPSLHAKEEAGVQHWPREEIVALLQSGSSAKMNASVLGPMAEVVAKSTQYWTAQDLQATAAYLQSLPASPAAAPGQPVRNKVLLDQGAVLYAKHCATCHGESGQGITAGQGSTAVAIPALANNRALTMHSSANLVRIILAGGYASATPGNPEPYGMPPFVHLLTDEDIAALSTYIRASWGNAADGVSAAQVVSQRRGVLR